MKKYIKILAVVALILSFLSCSKDDNSQPEVVSLLKKINDTSDGLISTYTYDTSKKLINYKLNGNQSNGPRDQNFTYNADGTLNEIRNLSDNSLELKYFYDSSKKIVKREGRNGIDIYTYEYANNKVTEKYIFTVNNEGFTNIYSYDAKGNMNEIKIYDNVTATNPNGDYYGAITYTYDNKKSYRTSLPKEFIFPYSNKNNYATEKYPNQNLYTYDFQFNEKGYPISSQNGARTYEYQ